MLYVSISTCVGLFCLSGRNESLYVIQACVESKTVPLCQSRKYGIIIVWENEARTTIFQSFQQIETERKASHGHLDQQNYPDTRPPAARMDVIKALWQMLLLLLFRHSHHSHSFQKPQICVNCLTANFRVTSPRTPRETGHIRQITTGSIINMKIREENFLMKSNNVMRSTNETRKQQISYWWSPDRPFSV